MKRLFYVRHGETEMNAAEIFSGTTETPLNENGKAQAIKTGKEIKAQLPKIDLIICSPLGRAHETAKLIAKEIDYPLDQLQKDERFIERTFGVLEGTPSTYYLGNDRANYQKLDDVEGAETIEDLQKRAAQALEYIKSLEDYDNILIVGHGAFGRALRRVVRKQPHTHEYVAPEIIPNAAIVELI